MNYKKIEDTVMDSGTNINHKKSRVSIFRSALLKNFSWTLIGSVFYSATQWGILAILAKWGNVEMVGLYSLGLAVTAPIVIFLNLQLREVQATDVKGEYNFFDYLAVRNISSIATFFLILIIGLNFYPEEKNFFVIIVIGLSKIIETYMELMYGIFQKHEKMDCIAKSKILRGSFSLVMMGAVLFFEGKNIKLITLSLLLSWAMVFVFYDLRKARLFIMNKQAKKVDLFRVLKFNKRSRKLMLLCMPLGIAGGLDTLNLNIPRYFVENFNSTKSLGYFSAIVYLMMLGGTVMSALGQSATARLSKYFNQSIEKYIKLMRYLIAFSIFIGCLGVLVAYFFGKEILSLVYSSEYAFYSDVFLIIMIAALLWYVSHMLWCGITAARSFKSQAYLYIVIILVSLTTSFILIPKYGLIGAAFSICFGMCTRLIGNIIIYVIVLRKNTLLRG